MEPTTAIGTGLAVLGSKDILSKLLGPSANYIGGEICNLVEKCNINIDGIFQKAIRKLGEEMSHQGTVNPRVLRHLLDDGRFCEDEIAAEYYGGVLASSRTESGRDDRGAGILTVIRSLSVYQLRFHYLAYTAIRHHFHGKSFNLGKQFDCLSMRVFIPTSLYDQVMDFSKDENGSNIMVHSLFGLKRFDLLHDFVSGDPEYLVQKFPQTSGKGPGIVVSPSLLGAELYMWASGVRGASGTEILKSDAMPTPREIPNIETTIPLLESVPKRQRAKN